MTFTPSDDDVRFNGAMTSQPWIHGVRLPAVLGHADASMEP